MDTKFASAAYRHFLIWGICASLAVTVCTIVDATLVGNLVGPNGLTVVRPQKILCNRRSSTV